MNMEHTTSKTLKILEKFYLVKIGMRLCDEKFLPLLITTFEPEEDPAIKAPVFTPGKLNNAHREPHTVVTYTEADEIVGRYQIIFLVSLYSAIPILGVVGSAVSHILQIVDSLLNTPNWIESTIYLLVLFAFIPFWAGFMIPIRERMKIWIEARDNELEIQKLEQFAMNKSSKIMAKILFEIEKLKDERQEEMQRVNKVRKKRSMLDIETMKMFNEMMNEREREIRRKGNMKAVLLSFAGFIVGYAFEKYFDYVLFGTAPNFNSTNK
jgi:hypothetical protein